jgi:hypothetical protein
MTARVCAHTREEHRQMKLQKEVRQTVNKLAHVIGIVHAEKMKISIFAEIESKMADGATPDDIANYLAALRREYELD